MKKQEGIYGNIQLNKQKYLDEFLTLYKQGLNDTEISKKLGVSYTTPRKWRIDMNLPKNFKYSVKFDVEKFKKLYNQGYNYSQIARELGSSSSAIQEYASHNGYNSNYLKYDKVTFTSEEFQVFLGTMYGDACLTKHSSTSNARMHFSHSLKQENYALWKYNILKRFCATPRLEQETDKRSGKMYESIRIYTKTNPIFTNYYNMFYGPEKIKHLNFDLLSKLEPLGLAVWFMDDGYKHSNSISIATNCFITEELEKLINLFKQKFDLEFTIESGNIIHLKAADLPKFVNLIQPYLHEDCKYKLDWYSLNSVKQGKTKEVVPVLNPQEIEEKAKRLDVMPNEKDEAIKSSTKAGHCSE